MAIDRDVWKNLNVTPDRAGLGRYLSSVLDMQPADVAWAGETLARIRAIAATSTIGHGVDPLRYLIVAADRAEITPTDIAEARSQKLNDLAPRAARGGITKLNPAQVFFLALAWVFLIGLPVILPQLPPEAQTVANGEFGAVSLALAITAMVTQKNK